MFEGLVRQLLLGYLGRYIKDIQKEQLKITLWNEEVLLENVELILEAFDYLQLPFALKEGRVGRLSIKIPWKKLGWDPIIIIIEDVFVCACQRDDQEWSMDAVERREFAGKKAKLAAAELAKLSRRVCGYQAGQSFVSYISTKILDGIQVSIRNVHILYRTVLPHSAQTIFGVKFSSLTIMRQNSLGGKVRGGQVNKTVEIEGFQIYCYTCPGNLDLARVDMAEDPRLRDRPDAIGKHDVCVLAPVDVSMSLEVSRSANENGVPQYSISAETTTLVMSLDEVQLKQILALCDYLSICELREKYGRYRPWNNPLSRKHKGWQIVWWHYAQQAVLSDIRKQLKKNSWKYLGERLTYRRKYVNLYKIKLKCLREEQFIDDHILGGLEQMERQCDIEDILNYRSIAESELQDFLQNSSSSLAASGGLALEKPQNDDYSSNKSRGWLNWLSLGMLGAGGTDDSSQFSGVVSDEVIKDIYEATEFQPTLSFNGDSYLGDHKFFSEIKFYINQVSATLWNTNLDREVAEIIFTGMSTECKIWEESAVVITSVNSGRMINTCNKQDILLASRASIESNAHEAQDPCLSVQIDLSTANQELKLLVKVKLQPVEVVYDSEFFLNVGQFYSVLDSAKSQHERVMLSLNEIDDVRARVTEKAKYMLSRRAKVILDVNVMDIKLGVPLGNAYQESSKMVLEMGSVMCVSKYETDCSAIHFEEKVLLPKNNSSSDSTRFLDDQLQDFYHHFEIEGNGCEVKVINPCHPGGVSILEKFDASVSLASCVIPNEPVFEQFQVCIVMPSLDVHFSPSIYGAVLALITSFDALRTNPDSLTSPIVDSLNIASSELRNVGAPFSSVNVSLKSIRFHVDLEGDKENGCHLMLRLHELSIRYNLAELQKFSISVKALKMISQSSQVDTDEQFLCSFGHPSLFANEQDIADKKTCQNGNFCHTSADRCFLLHYEEQRNREIVLHKYTISIGDVDCHCYPDIIRLLIEFADKITQYTESYSVKNWSHADMNGDMPTQVSYFGVEKFGFSNFYEAGSFYGTCTTLDCFPFVTIYNSGYLGNLEDILVHSTVDWRKCFEVGNRDIQSLESSMNKSELSQDVDGANILVDIDLMRMRMHFHDSSSTVATIFLPTTKLSLSICGDSFDILCSNKGLVLSSSWWIHNIQDYLWGPSSNDLSPIINVRVRKQKDELLGSKLEMSFSIQHVSCVLPPEFLSVIIGYFSLPDWCNKENEVTPSSKGMDSGGNIVIIYKFEVLDSTLFVPVEGREHRFLKLDIPQLYSSYIPDSCSELLMHGIPPDCLVPANKISERSHCLNVFGRDLSLLLHLLSGDELYSSVANQYSGSKGISFITAFSNDVWVRIPQEVDSSTGSSTSICLMVKVDCGELIFQDIYTFAGLEALEDIVNKFSTIDEESKTFTSDIHQFLQSKKAEKGIGPTQPVPSTVTYTEIECHVKSLSVSLNHLGSNSVSFEQIARIDMQFICSASLENEIARFLDVKFDSLALFSHLHSVTLAELTSSSGYSTVLDIHLAVSDEGECKVNVLLPSLDIWLHVFDWIEIIHLIGSYQKPQISTTIPDVSRSSVSGVVNEVENLSVYDAENSPRTLDASSSSPSGYMEKKDTVLVLKSKNIGIQVHIPLQVSREAFIISGKPQSGEGRHQAGSWKLDEGDEYIFAAVALQSRCSELVFVGGTARIKSNVEKVNGTVRVSEEKCSPSWPLFQISLVNIDAKILKDELDLVNLALKIQCDSLDMWLSFHILVFWNCMRFIFPELESGPAQSVFGTSELEIKLKKVSLLLTDGRGSSKGPLLELLMRNLLLHAKMSDKKLEGSVASDILVNYNNMHKVLWEPFVEPWKCQMNIYRIQENSVLLNTVIMTDILVTSAAQLNLNVTESLFEVIFRASDVVKDAGGAMGLKFLSESRKFLNSHLSGTMRIGSYAPYMLQNLTSLPLSFYVCKGPVCAGDMNISVLKDGKFIHPDSSVPIHINETSEEQLVDKQLNASGHHYIIIQFEGTSLPSVPISMDLVGLSYFEVDFSKSPSKISQGNNGDVLRRSKHDEVGPKNPKRGYVIPVICDVSVQRYCKLIRLYSTVILVNATSLPFEVRFDIPFSVVPKILDPVYPGQEFPLPLHLAEAGRVRWRPFGHSYVWSEVHNISDILSHEDRIGSMRSFVCSPSHPSNDPFRCCLSVQHICFPLIDRPDKSSVLHIDTSGKQTVELCNQNSHNLDRSKKPSIYQVVLCTPLVVKNYLPKAISLSIEGGGISRAALLSEEETSFFHIDSSHDLEVTFHFNGFNPSILKFQRMETFIGAAKLSGGKYSLSETVVFQPDSCNGPLYVSAEKTMDPLSGAREICFFVPFLLYNCTGFPIIISDSNSEMNGHGCIIPSCYDLDQSLYLERKDGLGLLCSSQDLSVAASSNDTSQHSFSKNRIVSTRKSNDTDLRELSKKAIVPSSSTATCKSSDEHDLDPLKASLHRHTNRRISSIQSGEDCPNMEEMGSRKVEAFMYSPDPNVSVTEIMIRVSKYLPECHRENMSKDSWSSPFPLVQPTGSTNVLIPHLSSSSAHIVSVSSSAVAGPFSGRIRMITFQPRYVISNACSRNVCYKQKGPDSIFDLETGQHSHLQWTDTARELLVSIRFKEPGWQWSGCFLPDHLGDTLVKMRNYVTGAVNMIRVEVQNADVSIQEEKIIGNLGGKSGTNLVLLSDDDTGFMPYRIDNFSTERLRVYQQRCETFETIVQPYTSCPYAWDEPCYPHRLTVEVVGERILGSFSLDDVSVHIPVYLSKTSEKSERTLLVSVHAEGAVKVLCVVDSSYHVLSGPGNSRVPQLKEQEKHDEERETFVNFKEKILVDIPFIGISLLSSDPQELLFACAKSTRIELHQSLDQQKFSFQISSFQIDNQLPNAPYPVILSFDREHSSKPVVHTRNQDNNSKIMNRSLMQIASDSISEPVICLAASKWRNRDIALVSFEYVSLRIGDFHLELEQDVILGLFDFVRTITSRLQAGGLSLIDSVGPHYTSLGFRKNTPSRVEVHKCVRPSPAYESEKLENLKTGILPLVVPIGAPWQRIHILARRQKKIYVENFDLAPIKLTLSFSSSPWLLRNGVLQSADYVIQRGLMALADVEGAQIRFKELIITHHMASQESIQEIIVRHYTRQLLHEMYKVFGSAGVIGNPMGFARSMGVGIKDFLSVPARSAIQSPAGLVAGMAQGTTSLLSNTVYALSDAATQFSRAAHKGIVALTFDDQAAARMEKQQKGLSSHSKGVINEFLEGLTGLLQSPIRGAEKHGLPGVVSGMALGITGLIARPAASILEVTTKTAQSIRNRSKLHHMGSRRFRMRLPRPLRRDHPLRPYSWEEAVGASVLAEADNNLKLKDELLVTCKMLTQGGKFVVLTEKLALIVYCSCLVDLGKPEFRGVPSELEWVVEAQISLDSVIHADTSEGVVNIVGSTSSNPMLSRERRGGGAARAKRWNNPLTQLPICQTSLELSCKEEAEEFLKILLSTIEKGKGGGWGRLNLLHQSNVK